MPTEKIMFGVSDKALTVAQAKAIRSAIADLEDIKLHDYTDGHHFTARNAWDADSARAAVTKALAEAGVQLEAFAE
jgi:hypothetical protein